MDGVLIIDKPAGMTSHDVVARVRRAIRQRRVGHSGTLDPFATGVLVVLIGKATRLAQFLSTTDKEYEAVIRLGYATDTGDCTGEPVNHDAEAEGRPFRTPSHMEVETALQALRGEITQVPPMYSAKKVGGQKLYELARRGETVDRKAQPVTIHEFALLTNNQHLAAVDGTLDLPVRVVCSAGTYIRVLAEDFGKLLSLGAHLVELRRTRAGKFPIKNAITLEQLEQMTVSGSLTQILVPPTAALSHLPLLHLSNADGVRTRNGLAVRAIFELNENWVDGELVRMCDVSGNLLAIGRYDTAVRLLHPRVVLATEKS